MLSVTQMQSSPFGLCPSCNRYIKTLTHYVSEAVSASFFRQEAPNLFDSLVHKQSHESEQHVWAVSFFLCSWGFGFDFSARRPLSYGLFATRLSPSAYIW